jgi:ribosome-binding protein aMBF1 (putative translation factor)
MDWQTHKKQLLKRPKFRRALKETELEYQVAKMLIDARIKKGYTQQELAKKLDTKQSVISRVESAKSLPSLTFLKKLASALGSNLRLELT